MAQKSPMILFDRLTAVSRHYSETWYSVPENGVFVVGNCLVEAGLIENMAQTISAGYGYNQRIRGKEILKGYLVSLKNLTIHRLPEVGTEIRTVVQFETSALDFKIFKGQIWILDDQIVESELRIYTPKTKEIT